MENLKDKQLMKLAGGVADERHAQSESKQTEAGYIQAAQKRMRQLNATVFTGHGIEFVRVPGEEKFRVRLTGDGVGTSTKPAAGAEDAGDVDLEPMDLEQTGADVDAGADDMGATDLE